MAVDTATYLPLQIFGGSSEIRSRRVTIPANQAVINALTPMKLNAAFKAIPAVANDDKIIGVTVPGLESQQGALKGTTLKTEDQFLHVYTHADIFADQVDFSLVVTAGKLADTDLKKAAMFSGTGISLVFAKAGQI